jgi:hypothetical protein
MGDEHPRHLTIAVPGVVASSPLGMGLHRTLKDTAAIVPMGGMPNAGALWRWSVRGTALDWFGNTKPAPSAYSTVPDVLLDLHGGEIRPNGRTWRVVDSSGNCVLRPFVCLATEASAPFVTSLYLIETDLAGAGWAVLAEAHISARRSVRGLLDAIGRTILWLLKTGIHGQTGVPRPWCPSPLGARRNGPRNVVRARLASLRARLRDHASSEIWAIGRIVEPIEEFIRTRTVEPDSWIEIPAREGFVADPFPWPGREDVVLYERFSHRTGLGSIECMSHLDGRNEIQKLDLQIGTHLSYPFTFQVDERVLCLPEMAAERRQVIYALDPGMPPRVLCSVAENVAMADPTLFRYGELFWIAYNDADLGLHENLCLLSASRIDGPWSPHPLNPVKVDVRSSRPAGAPFHLGGNLFRPAQDCSDSYGCALTMNRVIACTPSWYQEEPVAILLPNPDGRFPDGLHTFSVGPNGILMDGKRTILDWNILLQRLWKRVRKTRTTPD